MKQIYPSYYTAFRCIGGACGDNCCIGWEIEIDSKTLAAYRVLPGPLGARIRDNLAAAGDGTAHFRMKGDRCPMLTEDNLCQIILQKGPGSLCEVCDQHPRFHNWFGAEKESGLGLCCEAAARLILGTPEPLTLLEREIPEPADPEFVPGPCFAVLKRARRAALDLLGDRRQGIDVRLGLLLALGEDLQPALEAGESARMDQITARYESISHPNKFCGSLCAALDTGRLEQAAVWKEILDFFAGLLPIDAAWNARLSELREDLPALLAKRPAFLRLYPALEEEQERLACYFVYRYFMRAEFDGDLLAKVRLAAVSCLLVQLLELEVWHRTGALDFEARSACARQYSKELEYCQENLDALALELWTAECFSLRSLLALLTESCRINGPGKPY